MKSYTYQEGAQVLDFSYLCQDSDNESTESDLRCFALAIFPFTVKGKSSSPRYLQFPHHEWMLPLSTMSLDSPALTTLPALPLLKHLSAHFPLSYFLQTYLQLPCLFSYSLLLLTHSWAGNFSYSPLYLQYLDST